MVLRRDLCSDVVPSVPLLGQTSERRQTVSFDCISDGSRFHLTGRDALLPVAVSACPVTPRPGLRVGISACLCMPRRECGVHACGRVGGGEGGHISLISVCVGYAMQVCESYMRLM